MEALSLPNMHPDRYENRMLDPCAADHYSPGSTDDFDLKGLSSILLPNSEVANRNEWGSIGKVTLFGERRRAHELNVTSTSGRVYRFAPTQ
jgi:hypothetical protein